MAITKKIKNIFLVNKKEGETPLEALEAFRFRKKIPKNIKMTYAGRLDPMASGLLLILTGEEIKNKEKYLKLGKVYDFEVLFGFSTDTYDILGKVTHSNIRTNVGMKDLEKIIKENLKYFKGKFLQKYPAYSSKYIKKVRKGENVEREERMVSVKSLKFLGLRKISSKKLLQNIEKRIKKVKGDFRQNEITRLWKKYLRTSAISYTVASFKIRCSSGTYVRAIGNSLGERVGMPALAYSIKRTKLGKWSQVE